MPHELSPADKEYYHNLGQQHASEGKYESPAGGVNAIITTDVHIARHEAYMQGLTNTTNQKE